MEPSLMKTLDLFIKDDDSEQDRVSAFNFFHHQESEMNLGMRYHDGSSIQMERIGGNTEENSVTHQEEIPIPQNTPKILYNGKPRKSFGCRCSKTGCKTGYCTCLKNGVKCGSECGCRSCDNNSFKRYYRGTIEDFRWHSKDYKLGKKIRKY